MEEVKPVELLTVSEAARRMHVSRQTIYTWIHEGRVKPVFTPGGRHRIPEDQLIIQNNGALEKQTANIFPIHDISELEPIRIEQMGTKEKYWFSGRDKYWYWNTEGKEFLFKAGREGSGENWAEKVADELCALLELPHARYDLAKYRGVRGAISPNFVPNGAWLRHGNEILASYISDYEKSRRYHQRKHTVRIVLAVVTKIAKKNIQLPIGWTNPGEFDCAADVFTGYLMLDAWIANQDRHHENWGLIIVPDDGIIHLAPTFDHASSLGRNELDHVREERLKTKDVGRGMERFVERARSAFYRTPSDIKPLSTLEAFNEAASRRPDAARFWINRLEQISFLNITGILDKVPSDELSDVGKEFTQKLLELNKQRIVSLKVSLKG